MIKDKNFPLKDLSTPSTKLYKSNKYYEGRIKPYKGTTTLAFITNEGIVIAVDSRATSGQYIASQSVNKVIEINKHLLGTMAGGAADCFYWEHLMGAYAKKYQLENSRRITVRAASKYLSDRIYSYLGRGLSIGSLICGVDDAGFAVYYVDDEGLRITGDIFSCGSGSTIAYGVLNKHYNKSMSKEDGLTLGKKAIFHATHRDAYSGGVCNLYFLDRNGWEKIGSYDVDKLYYEFIKNGDN